MRGPYGWWSALLIPVTGALIWIALGLPGRAYTGLVLRGDRVEEVILGSPADRAGFHVGDRLLPHAGGAAQGRDDADGVRTVGADQQRSAQSW